MEPWQSWILIGIIGAGAAYYYANTGQKKRYRGRTALAAETNHHADPKAHSDGKDKRKREKETVVSNVIGGDKADPSAHSTSETKAELPKKRKGNKKQPINPGQGSGADVRPRPETITADEEDEEISNLEFAKQLNNAKVGTSLKKPDGISANKQGKKKAKPITHAPEIPNGHVKSSHDQVNSQDMSRTSSTGADADDDLSPANSPDLGAASAKIVSGTDVTDMLEAPAKGPSILRVTEPTKPQPVKQAKVKASAPEAETKKQRQNRRKREEQKALREETEKERRSLLERQLRTAREAEGRPAKNGLGEAQVPSTKAWSSSSAANGNLATLSSKSVAPLLDTLEDKHSAAGSSGVGVNGFSSDHPHPYRDLPSEEEQIRMLSEMDSDNAWNTVDKGGKAKKKAKTVTQPDLNAANHSLASNIEGISSDANETSTHLTLEPQLNLNSNQPANNTNTQPTSTAKELQSGRKSEAKMAPVIANEGYAMNDKNSTALVSPNTAGSANLGGHTTPVHHNGTSNLSIDDTLASLSEDGKTPAVSMEASSVPEQAESAGTPAISVEAAGEGIVTGQHSKPKQEAVYEGKQDKVTDPLRIPLDSSKYPWQHDGPLFKKWVARNHHIQKTIDRSVWNYENIKNHPFYDERWPWALIGHPLDSDWVAYDPDFDYTGQCLKEKGSG